MSIIWQIASLQTPFPSPSLQQSRRGSRYALPFLRTVAVHLWGISKVAPQNPTQSELASPLLRSLLRMRTTKKRHSVIQDTQSRRTTNQHDPVLA